MKSVKNIFSNVWVVTIVLSLLLVACAKGDEPMPMSSANEDNSSAVVRSTGSAINTEESERYSKDIVGGDDNEDDDDNKEADGYANRGN